MTNSNQTPIELTDQDFLTEEPSYLPCRADAQPAPPTPAAGRTFKYLVAVFALAVAGAAIVVADGTRYESHPSPGDGRRNYAAAAASARADQKAAQDKLDQLVTRGAR